MREILFRAKRIDNGEWQEGYLFDDGMVETKHYFVGWICVEPYKGTACDTWTITGIDFCEIDPETICQYTGLKDKNGNRIWENDIIKHEISDTIGTVKWYQEDYVGWCVDDTIIDEQQFTDEMWNECEVIGNIFDNPETAERRMRMQELEKILKEIEEGTHTFELLGRDVDFVAIDWVRDVIRKHMNDGWIPVEEHPKKDYTAVFAVDKHDYYFVAVYDKEHGYRTNDVGADVDNIVAYCLFNPYRPERSE